MDEPSSQGIDDREVVVGWRGKRIVVCDLKGTDWVKLKNGVILIDYSYILG